MSSRNILVLLGTETILPVDKEGSDTVLAVAHRNNHGLRIHGLTSVELVVTKVFQDLLDVALGTLLEGSNTAGIALLELGLDGLHVSLDADKETLLVKAGLFETETVDDIDDLIGLVVAALVVLTLGGGVGTSVHLNGALGHHLAVDLVDGIVDFDLSVRVTEELVVYKTVSKLYVEGQSKVLEIMSW